MLIHLDGVDRQLALLDDRAGEDRRPATLARARSPADARFAASRPAPRWGSSQRSATSAASRIRASWRLARDHAERVFLRRSATPRPHHQDRQPPRPPPARRGRLALPPPTLPPQAAPANRPTAPGTPRSACTDATTTSSSAASARPSSTSRSPASFPRFIWAEMTGQPHRQQAVSLNPPTVLLGPGDQRARPEDPRRVSMRSRLATLVRGSSRSRRSRAPQRRRESESAARPAAATATPAPRRRS